MAVEVGYQFLNLSADVFMNGENKEVIIDSGTTLAYLPDVIYSPLVKKVVCYYGSFSLFGGHLIESQIDINDST